MAKVALRSKPVVNDVAKISNSLIEAFVKQNNLVAIKTLFYISRSNVALPSVPLATISLDTTHLCDYCGIDIKTLKRNIKQMTETSISIIDDKSESYITVIPKARFVKGTNKLEVDVYKEILELVWQVERRFTVVNVKALMNLNSKHSVRMIQLLEMINGFSDLAAKRKIYSLSELNLMFGTSYSKFSEFERKILSPVKAELDINSKLSFVYQITFIDNPKGRGRPIADKVQIDLVRNTPQGSLF